MQPRIPSLCPDGRMIIGYKNKEEHTADMHQDVGEGIGESDHGGSPHTS